MLHADRCWHSDCIPRFTSLDLGLIRDSSGKMLFKLSEDKAALTQKIVTYWRSLNQKLAWSLGRSYVDEAKKVWEFYGANIFPAKAWWLPSPPPSPPPAPVLPEKAPSSMRTALVQPRGASPPPLFPSVIETVPVGAAVVTTSNRRISCKWPALPSAYRIPSMTPSIHDPVHP